MIRITILTAVALLLGVSAGARAQAEHYANRPLELNVHAGGILFDDLLGDETEPIVGARFVYNMASGWGIGGNFDYAPLSREIFEFDDGVDLDVDLDVYLYSADINYTFPSETQLHAFVAAGAGAATFSVEDGDSDTDFLLPLGGGVKWFNRTNDPDWGVRAELRDNIIFVETADDTDATNNFEFSGGVSFFFGGR